MNKQELIDKYEAAECVVNFVSGKTLLKTILRDLKQLDEQKPVKVPQCVAEYINLQKKNNFHVYGAMRVIEDHYDKKVPEWFYGKNIETFVRAWLDGYEVEEEKRYVVRVKGVEEDSAYLKHQLQNNHWYYGSLTECSLFSPYHTRKELEEANFGWVLDCPGIELEEVE